MGRPIDLGRYSTVDQRIRAFYRRFSDGSIRTDLLRMDAELVVFRARVFRDRGDPVPTTGWAYDRPPADAAGARRVLANCEAAAVGRALANLGLAGPLRPCREEMEKVVRLRAAAPARTGATDTPRTTTASGPQQRIRALLAGLRLPAEKRRRIATRLAQGITDQQAHEIEAYLLALRSRSPARRRAGVDGGAGRR